MISTLGNNSRNRMRRCEAPCARAATTNSRWVPRGRLLDTPRRGEFAVRLFELLAHLGELVLIRDFFEFTGEIARIFAKGSLSFLSGKDACVIRGCNVWGDGQGRSCLSGPSNPRAERDDATEALRQPFGGLGGLGDRCLGAFVVGQGLGFLDALI